MWVRFFLEETSADKIIFSRYQAEDEPAVELPRELNSAELMNLVLEKASMDPDELRRKGAVNVNLPLVIFDELVLQPMRRQDSGSQSSTEELFDTMINIKMFLGQDKSTSIEINGRAVTVLWMAVLSYVLTECLLEATTRFLNHLGFTPNGIAGGSIASAWQALYAGQISSNSVFSRLQAYAMSGPTFTHRACVFVLMFFLLNVVF
ncbi:uncharacterized protein [Dermacentor albipictus]|uniref:uncharacterized protein n=1 Tax=Dermacentor albipictus TaxID=60249 RepID=UPI0038FCD1D6